MLIGLNTAPLGLYPPFPCHAECDYPDPDAGCNPPRIRHNRDGSRGPVPVSVGDEILIHEGPAIDAICDGCRWYEPSCNGELTAMDTSVRLHVDSLHRVWARVVNGRPRQVTHIYAEIHLAAGGKAHTHTIVEILP